MSVGIDCGGQKIALVAPDLGIYAAFDLAGKRERHVVSRMMRNWLVAYRGAIREQDIWMEAPVLAGARNIQSTIKVAQTTGLVHSVLEHVFEVPVSSWKKRTVGSGNASKDDVRDWLDGAHPDIARMCRGNQDLYDAACIALYGDAVRQELEASGLTAVRSG